MKMWIVIVGLVVLVGFEMLLHWMDQQAMPLTVIASQTTLAIGVLFREGLHLAGMGPPPSPPATQAGGLNDAQG